MTSSPAFKRSTVEKAIIVIGTLIFFVILYALYFYPPLLSIDYRINQIMEKIDSPLLTNLLLFITDFGSWGALIIGIIGTILFFAAREKFFLRNWVISFTGAATLSVGIKLVVLRPRPSIHNLVYIFGHSFPSGHALISLVAYGIAAFHLKRKVRSPGAKTLIVLTAALVIVMVGFSRIYLKAHYFSDVLAGYAIGSVWLILCIFWAKRR